MFPFPGCSPHAGGLASRQVDTTLRLAWGEPARRANSERFRSAPRTSRPYCSSLKVPHRLLSWEANHERAGYTREAGLGFGHAWGGARDRALFGSVSPRDLSVRIRSGLKPGSAWNSRAHAGNRVVPSDCRPCKVVLERFSQRERASYSTYYSRSFPPPAPQVEEFTV